MGGLGGETGRARNSGRMTSMSDMSVAEEVGSSSGGFCERTGVEGVVDGSWFTRGGDTAMRTGSELGRATGDGLGEVRTSTEGCAVPNIGILLKDERLAGGAVGR